MSALADILRQRILDSGPIGVAEFMALALGHAEHGYYRNRDPLGAKGDFITAPEISQMFGELIGLWAAIVWQQMGQPDSVDLVELGPGRGTLMADALRAAQMLPDFRRACRLHLVETSPALRARQREALAGIEVAWHDDLDAVPPGPAIIIANEFFDALPIRQFLRCQDGWRERLITYQDGFAFAEGKLAKDGPAIWAAPGAIAETCPQGQAIAARIGARLKEQGGAALIIDYGYFPSAAGDTLQAVKGHQYHPVLQDPGEADLTAHVDFDALARAACATGAVRHGPIGQGDFLKRLGIVERAEALAKAAPDKRIDIATRLDRLIAPSQMGNLFKVLAVTSPGQPKPPAF